ncbi:MAG: hypothetical protein K2I53_08280 [Lachnospiraceae bacterium]|nr:hypothetical protein [Lachnospiraceae bacterium]
MKKFAINVLTTTGLTLVLLSVIALFFQAQCIFLQTVFQILSANIVFHFGFLLISKLEMKRPFAELFLNIAMIIILLLVFGSLFDWFSSTPVWILIPMGLVIYIISAVLQLFSMRQDAQEINTLIRERKGR